MKILLAFGTRPEAIKMCPLILEMKKTKSIETVVCLTGQHREMLMQVMDAFGLNADYNLEIMKAGQTLSSITTDILGKMNSVLEKEQPDMVLVHGDTTTSFAVALSAFYKQIPIGHIEAGLRTFNMASPYPEEFNRQAVDLISDVYFAPTQTAERNLLRENKAAEKIFVTGNTVIDALNTTIRDDYVNENLSWAKDSKLILMTAHRRENLGEPMRNIFNAVKRVVKDNPDVKVIYPVHKNPVIRTLANEVLGDVERIRMIESLDVIDFHNFMKRSYLLLTDSGGIQEEAPALGKPVLVLRDTTERPEGVEAGTIKLVGTAEEMIYQETCKLLHDESSYMRMSRAVNPYGDGHASERIIENIIRVIPQRKGK